MAKNPPPVRVTQAGGSGTGRAVRAGLPCTREVRGAAESLERGVRWRLFLSCWRPQPSAGASHSPLPGGTGGQGTSSIPSVSHLSPRPRRRPVDPGLAGSAQDCSRHPS